MLSRILQQLQLQILTFFLFDLGAYGYPRRRVVLLSGPFPPPKDVCIDPALYNCGRNCSIWHPWDLQEFASTLANVDPDRLRLVLGISLNGHDSSLAATLGGEVIGVIELERLHKIRYFDFVLTLQHAMKHLSTHPAMENTVEQYLVPALGELCLMISKRLPRGLVSQEPCQVHYDVAVLVADGLSYHSTYMVEHVINASKWVMVDHQHAHAAHGWLDSPFYHYGRFVSPQQRSKDNNNVTIILSYDGWANDGSLRCFIGRPGNATLSPLGQAKLSYSYGIAYTAAASAVRDLAWGSPYGSQPPCPYDVNPACHLALAGSFMAFAAIGKIRKEWCAGARLYISRGLWDNILWPSPFGGLCELATTRHRGFLWLPGGQSYFFVCAGAQEDEDASRMLDRDFAATVQHIFEIIILDTLRSKLAELVDLKATSLIIAGGCALNVKANSFLARELSLPAYVSSAPGDHGLSVGAAWLIDPPIPGHRSLQLHFAGAPLLKQGEIVEELVSGIKMRKLDNVTELADLLFRGAIVAVARGRAEFGPRALGHRSFLASAQKVEQKERLNRLKHRRWYRPCAPIVLAEDLELLFEPGFDLAFGAPHMSFAPPLQQWVEKWLPGISHIDNTARPQGVQQDDDPWMHSLLVAVRSIMSQQRAPADPPAVGVLINTSLNAKGKPIASDVKDVLSIFCMPHGNELDYVLLEETWLIDRASVESASYCATQHEKFDYFANLSDSPDNLPII